MASRIVDVDDSGSGMRGSVSPQQLWQILSLHSEPFFALFNARADKAELIAKFMEVDEDLAATAFEEQDISCAESAWNSVDGDGQ